MQRPAEQGEFRNIIVCFHHPPGCRDPSNRRIISPDPFEEGARQGDLFMSLVVL
jgi:uracil-DNA glycosylase